LVDCIKTFGFNDGPETGLDQIFFPVFKDNGGVLKNQFPNKIKIAIRDRHDFIVTLVQIIGIVWMLAF